MFIVMIFQSDRCEAPYYSFEHRVEFALSREEVIQKVVDTVTGYFGRTWRFVVISSWDELVLAAKRSAPLFDDGLSWDCFYDLQVLSEELWEGGKFKMEVTEAIQKNLLKATGKV